MRRKIPSTAALTAFESAARHQSFTRAAAELAVTQSAVCRQVASLEDFLGVKLFRRTKRGITLTEAGVSYHHQVSARLDELERDTLELMAQGGAGGTLELGVVPTFGTKWLLPRLAAFAKAHPGVNVNLAPRVRPFLFDETPLDAAIYAGDAAWPGTEAHFLMRENLIAVASPALIAPLRTLKPGSLRRYVLLQQSTRPYAWRHWFSSLQMEVENDMVGPRLELFSMLTEAAIQGLGIALIPRFLIEEELRAGRLIEVVRHAYLSDRSYYLIYPERKSENATLSAFRDWLIEEAASYRDAAGLA
ncbi:LysR family transcriptional regulator [Piscinibacter terrae]|uniref:LysR family transcriptional regulator n=1 Tax=Piscinibacter terrae TaxID=2496871 RepID=A0A3N7HM98_9BURK|nr:LysR family transcriptional regulator [Albitalea terrae]RQP21751.1 LysR family transcriptional regulator [Albitalea terrae]